MSPDTAPPRHRHTFSALSYTFGPYGDQDVHVHPCFTEGCDVAVIGEGRTCTPGSVHHRWKYTEDGWKKGRREPVRHV